MNKMKISAKLDDLNELAERIRNMKKLEARIGLAATLHGCVEEIRTALSAEPAKAPPLEKVL
ncbi:MAG: hypothetical protein WAV50_00840 [Minisyncoccia bacterium]